MIRNFALAALVSFVVWYLGDALGLLGTDVVDDPEADGPLVIEEYVKVVTPDDITPGFIADNGTDGPGTLVGRLAVGAKRVAWRMDCPLVIGSRGWSDHDKLRPAENPHGVMLPPGASYVLRNVKVGTRRPHLVVPGLPPPNLKDWPPLYVSLIEVPPNRPCIDPKTARTWHGSVTVVAAPMVAPEAAP